ncbi:MULTISPECIES: TlpA family protein disulfide reductase [unclassified Chryseobacterium]|uniref:TlpA family protein disulfide reductase n=1 Tax=unclassified Chryseobacterium TaxID=2593645 RepID=UPI000D34D357|nr:MULTISPECIES: TlpA disulfide reductase family protein [unclassified Chryseobacterium]PTT76979.1 TlpA family protein disulfide reductase [Chryseobacterium sp. HMWF001]PVV58301.1 TlpA family protein disulfide reductase [Chryseobacterium sp. HMWF035]
MDKFLLWIRKNWSTVIMIAVLILLWVNPDAKAWVMRQMISTGLFNSKIEEKTKESSLVPPNFSVRNEDGEIIDTSQLRGKVVFINFWASWCPPCRAEFPSVQKFYDAYKANQNLVFLTVNLDDEIILGKNYLQKEKFTIPFLVPSSSIPKELYSGSIPTTIVLDKTGKIRMHHSGMADYSKDSFYQEIEKLLKE